MGQTAEVGPTTSLEYFALKRGGARQGGDPANGRGAGGQRLGEGQQHWEGGRVGMLKINDAHSDNSYIMQFFVYLC